MSKQLEKLKGSRYYGLVLLAAMLVVVYGFFKILTPNNFGSLNNLSSYLQSSIIYSVGGCGLYFIVVMGLFDFAVGSNVVLSSIVGVILSQKFGYVGFVLGCLGCGTLLGLLIGLLYNRLNVPSMIVTVARAWRSSWPAAKSRRSIPPIGSSAAPPAISYWPYWRFC